MVTKKTSIDEIKQVSTSAPKAAVKKPQAVVKAAKTTEKNTPAKSLEPKKAVKSATVKKAVKAAPAPASVLEIKAKNEAKKSAKPAKVKAAAVAQKSAAIEAKGEKAFSTKSKRDAVKESAQKAEAKKFKALKEQSEPVKKCRGCCCCLGLKTMLGAWVKAYRKIFDYKTRSSRYDFWAYALINLIVSLFVTVPYRNALFSGDELSVTMQVVYWTLCIIMMFASLALVVRRLHDMGKSGWKGFFAPLTYTALGLVVLTAVGNFIIPDDANPEQLETLSASLLGIGVLVLLLVNFYYLCKTFIAASFMEGEPAENAYGLPIFADDCTRAKILRYASLYVVIFTIYMVILLTALYYLSMVMLMGGRGIY